MAGLARRAGAEAPAMSRSRGVEVAIVEGGRAPETLDYEAPAALPAAARRGAVVSVPLGPRRTTGIVLGPASAESRPTSASGATQGASADAAKGGRSRAPAALRPIHGLLADAALPEDALALAEWAAAYYRAPRALLYRALLPPDARQHSRKHVVPLRSAAPEPEPTTLFAETEPMGRLEDRILARLPAAGLAREAIRREFGREADAALRRLVRRGDARIDTVAIERRNEGAALRAVAEWEGDLARAPRQAELLAAIRARAPRAITRAELLVEFPAAPRLVRELLAKGAVEECEQDAEPGTAAESGPALRPAQAEALAAVQDAAASFSPFLLFGVTGSGKTEVHLRAAAHARARGRSVLLLVPEIGLTPQLLAQANARFPGDVAVLHSALTPGERARTWQEVANGRRRVVIGPRSAVFAPVHDLGLIVVDEEHDGAWKQEELPRYHGRDVAVMRARLADCPILLSSATPSLESWQNAQSGKYRLLRMPDRANDAPLPTVRLVDMRDVGRGSREVQRAGVGGTDRPGPADPNKNKRGIPIFSPQLEDALLATFAAGEQSLLFLNRRGWSRFLQCEMCGHVDTCPDCSVSLTVHRKQNAAICHHCGFARPPATLCPDCESPLSTHSFGTEQVEEALRGLVPEARIARLDRDTGSRGDHLHRTLQAWRAGELDILVGTQMVAKGHDAPGVTLIGVVNADSSLHFPDFRAAERTFQLLTQVAGRAGRGERPGRVLIQTRQPEHPSLTCARTHDFEGFAASELPSRGVLAYPPFGRLVRIVIEAPEAAAEREAGKIAAHLRRAVGSTPGVAPGEVQVLGPAPAPIERLRGRLRQQILLKGSDASKLARSLARAALHSGTRGETRTIIDVDPSGML